MPRGQITRETPIPFGKHKGEKLKDVPKGYLRWYSDKGEIDDWVVACQRELKHRKEDDDSRGNNGKPPEESVPTGVIPCQSDHMLTASVLMRENYHLMAEALGRPIEDELLHPYINTDMIALSRQATIDWAVVEREQRRLHKDLSAK